MPPLERIGELEASQEARRLQLQDEPSHTPTSSRYPSRRPDVRADDGNIGDPQTAVARGLPRAKADREYESYEWYESFSGTLPAGTAFTDIGAFSGRPENIQFQASAIGIDVRFRNRGQAPGSAIRVAVTGTQTLGLAAEVAEARDPTGAGGQLLTVIGRFVHRSPLVRELRHAAAAGEGAGSGATP